MSFTALLNSNMDVVDAHIAADSHGAQVRTDVVKYKDIPCRIVQLSMNEAAIMQRAGVTTTHRLVCDSGLIWENPFEIIVAESNGRTTRYRITSFDDMSGSLNNFWTEVLCERLL